MVDVEKLIELVKNHEFLYDLSHRDYKNTKLKVDTWELIAKNLNSTSKCTFYIQQNDIRVY